MNYSDWNDEGEDHQKENIEFDFMEKFFFTCLVIFTLLAVVLGSIVAVSSSTNKIDKFKSEQIPKK